MSKNQPQAQQKPGMWQNILLLAIIMFTVQMFMNRNNQTEGRTRADIIAAMQTDNQKILDLTIARDFNALQNRLKTDNLTQDQKNALEMEGAVLVADTQVKAAVLRDDLRRLNSAYTLLQGYDQKWEGESVWSQTFPVSKPEKGPIAGAENPANAQAWSPKDLYQHTVNVLDQKNRDTLVWGIFPGWQMIDFLVKSTGAKPGFSYWFAAILLAVALRAILYPLSQKQMMYSRQIQQLNPLVKELKDKFKDNPTEFQQRQMALFKEYGLNPAAGCLPMLIQMPLIFMIYQCMLHYRFEFQKGTFLWINAATHAHIPWIAPNLGQKDYILLAVYAVSMVTTSMLMPVADPTNMKQQRMMQIGTSAIFAVMLFFYPALPSGFVLYWSATNVLTTLQVLLIYRKPLDPLVKVNTKDGGVYPTDGRSNGSGGNGKPKGPFDPSDFKVGPVKTGVPVKHKPKKRK
jgi:YidC/Oxa1 family membrane protein insertase